MSHCCDDPDPAAPYEPCETCGTPIGYAPTVCTRWPIEPRRPAFSPLWPVSTGHGHQWRQHDPVACRRSRDLAA